MTQKAFLNRKGWGEMLAVGLMITLFTVLPVSAQELVWEPTNGPYGGYVSALLATPDGRLYAATNGAGIFRSEDKGDTWFPVNNGLTSNEVRSLFIMGTTLFAGTSGGTFGSNDGGDSWAKIESPNTYINYLAILGTTIFASGDGKIFRSEDGGKTWIEVNLGLANPIITSAAIIGATLYLGIEGKFLYKGAEGGSWISSIIRSKDGGNTWKEINIGLTNFRFSSLAIMDSTLFAGTEGGGVFQFDDRSYTWTAVRWGLKNPYITAMVVMDTTLYVGTSTGVFRSDDRGRTWTEIGTISAGLTNTSVWSLAVLGMTIFAGTKGGGVFRSEDGCNTWIEVNRGLTNIRVVLLSVLNNTLYAGTSNGLFRSEDGGNTWISTNKGLGDYYVFSLANLDKTLYAGTNGGGVFRSDDGGNSWARVNGLRQPVIYSLVVLNKTLYVGTMDGVFRSEDGGNSWTSINIGFRNFWTSGCTGFFKRIEIRSLAVSEAILYAGTWHGIFRSDNGGKNWYNIARWKLSVYSLAVSGTTIYAGTTNGMTICFKDEDITWAEIKTGLKRVYRVRSLAVLGQTLFSGTGGEIFENTGNGVFRSEDGGNSWIPTGLTNSNVWSLVVLDTTLYAGTMGGGILRASISR